MLVAPEPAAAFAVVPGSGQCGAVSAGRRTRLAAKDRRQMALVGETSLLSNQGEGLMAPAQQGFRAVKPTLYDVALRTDPNCKLERAAENDKG